MNGRQPSFSRGCPQIALDDVHFAYPGWPLVLKEISATVEQGQIVCILGANASGKSTLMGIIGGLLEPTSGTVSYSNGAADALTPTVCSVIDGCTTARARGAKPVSVQPLRWQSNDRSTEIFGALSINPGDIPRRKQLSRGQRHRLALAEAMLARPATLIVDDPFNELDAVGQSVLLELLARHRSDGAAIVLATSDVLLACQAADRIGILRDGHLRWEHPDDVMLNVHQVHAAGLCPPSHVDRIRHGSGLRQHSMTGAHASRLAAVVRDRLSLDRDAHVLLQQSRADRHHARMATSLITVDRPEMRTWLFAGPLCDLSPIELSKTLIANPEGHTHVASL